ncbi:MAG: serine hydrolase domain-containing protein [Chitinophagia bacterium]|jgi:D-alanyl-D-alanine carboxypeptidase
MKLIVSIFEKYRLISTLLVIVIISSCNKKDNSPTISEIREQEFQKILSDAKLNTQSPALMLSVARPSKNWSWSGAIGKANIGSSENATVQHRFRVASVTKMFTAAAILLLEEEKKLSLTDPISIHLSTSMFLTIKNKIPNADNITIRNLLNHTSSLGEYTGKTDFINLFPNKNSAPTRQQVIEIGLKYSPAGSFGSWNYSNTGYNLLSIIIEKVSGKDYRTFIKERIIDYLKLSNTYFPNDEFMQAPFITPYFTLTPPAKEADNFATFNCNWAIGTGDLVSSLSDLQTFMQALIQGKLITSQSILKMNNNPVSSSYTGLPGEKYGLGVFMCDNPEFFGHAGDLFGIHTKVFYINKIDTYIITVLNLNDNDTIAFEMIGTVSDWIKNNDN